MLSKNSCLRDSDYEISYFKGQVDIGHGKDQPRSAMRA